MSLEFHPMGTGLGYSINVAVDHVEVSVMGLRHVGNDGATFDAGK